MYLPLVLLYCWATTLQTSVTLPFLGPRSCTHCQSSESCFCEIVSSHDLMTCCYDIVDNDNLMTLLTMRTLSYQLASVFSSRAGTKMPLATRLRLPLLHNQWRIRFWGPAERHSNSEDQKHGQTACRYLQVSLLGSSARRSTWMQTACKRSNIHNQQFDFSFSFEVHSQCHLRGSSIRDILLFKYGFMVY